MTVGPSRPSAIQSSATYTVTAICILARLTSGTTETTRRDGDRAVAIPLAFSTEVPAGLRRSDRITRVWRMADRTESLLSSIDVASSKGLELGPLAKPVVRRDMGDVRYLDHVDTDALRARYATHDGFDVDAIVPIDYVSINGSIHDAVSPDIPFDYVIASHVIEHVPDLIGWLRDIRGVLRDDGVLSLAIPDHRRCFDALRSPTVTADVIDAHLTKPTIPTPRQVFDHYSCAVAWHGYDLVGGGTSIRGVGSRAFRSRGARPSGCSGCQRRIPRRPLLGVHAARRSVGCSRPCSACTWCRSRSSDAPRPSAESSSQRSAPQHLPPQLRRPLPMAFLRRPPSMPPCEHNCGPAETNCSEHSRAVRGASRAPCLIATASTEYATCHAVVLSIGVVPQARSTTARPRSSSAPRRGRRPCGLDPPVRARASPSCMSQSATGQRHRNRHPG